MMASQISYNSISIQNCVLPYGYCIEVPILILKKISKIKYLIKIFVIKEKNEGNAFIDNLLYPVHIIYIQVYDNRHGTSLYKYVQSIVYDIIMFDISLND